LNYLNIYKYVPYVEIMRAECISRGFRAIFLFQLDFSKLIKHYRDDRGRQLSSPWRRQVCKEITMFVPKVNTSQHRTSWQNSRQNVIDPEMSEADMFRAIR
jgi:hypothetical protein